MFGGILAMLQEREIADALQGLNNLDVEAKRNLAACILQPAYPRHSVKISSRYGIGAVRTAA